MQRIGGRRLAALAFGGFLAVGLGSPALADNDVGCGLGTQFMEGRSGLVYHLLASCTNAYTFQSVSLTLNMFGCDSTGTVTVDAQLRKFAAANLDQLSRDVARGQGESLSALAHLLQVPAGQHDVFGAFTQAHFVDLFPHEGVTSNEMVDAFYRLLDTHPVES